MASPPAGTGFDGIRINSAILRSPEQAAPSRLRRQRSLSGPTDKRFRALARPRICASRFRRWRSRRSPALRLSWSKLCRSRGGRRCQTAPVCRRNPQNCCKAALEYGAGPRCQNRRVGHVCGFTNFKVILSLSPIASNFDRSKDGSSCPGDADDRRTGGKVHTPNG